MENKIISFNIVKSILYGTLSSAILIGAYFTVLSLLSGWKFAQDQFAGYWYFIISLAVGFGIQIALYQYLKSIVYNGRDIGKVVGASGTTSTLAMISCCAHYLVNIMPIIGISGFVTIMAQYQIQLFWVGIIFNILGIIFITSRIKKFKGASI